LPANAGLDAEFFVPKYIKLCPVFLSVLSFYIIYGFESFNSRRFFLIFDSRPAAARDTLAYLTKKIYRFLREKAYFNFFYNGAAANFFLREYALFFKAVDTNFLEIFGPLGLSVVFRNLFFGLLRSEKTFFSFYFLSFMLAALHFSVLFTFFSFY
jgi:hypothetical protein